MSCRPTPAPHHRMQPVKTLDRSTLLHFSAPRHALCHAPSAACAIFVQSFYGRYLQPCSAGGAAVQPRSNVGGMICRLLHTQALQYTGLVGLCHCRRSTSVLAAVLPSLVTAVQQCYQSHRQGQKIGLPLILGLMSIVKIFVLNRKNICTWSAMKLKVGDLNHEYKV